MRARWVGRHTRLAVIVGAGMLIVLAPIVFFARLPIPPNRSGAPRHAATAEPSAAVSASPAAARYEELAAPRLLVRVLLKEASESVELVTAAPCRVLEATVGRDHTASAAELGRVASGERITLTVLDPVGLRCGRWTTSRGVIVIRPEPLAAAGVWVGDRLYRGEIRGFRGPGRSLTIVNAVPLELYVATVVDSEMPASFPPAARRAQAIVARTYVLSRMIEARGHPHFDVYDDARSQRYLGFQYGVGDRRLAGETAAGRAAASQTRGVVCVSRGKLLRTYYSAVCGGRTTRGAAVFRDAVELQSVDCDWCRTAALYRWQRRVDVATLDRQLRQWLQAQSVPGELVRLAVVDPQHVSDRQAVPTLRLQTTSSAISVSASRFRRLVEPALPSPFFLVHRDGSTVVFDGRGSGHGVGLCQHGAAGLANAGRTTRQILAYYYPAAQLVRLTW